MADPLINKLDGITFYLDHTEVELVPGQGRYVGRCTLCFEYADESIWELVKNELSTGYRICTVRDFHAEIIEVMSVRIKELEQQCSDLGRQIARAQEETKHLRGELERYKTPFRKLGEVLGTR